MISRFRLAEVAALLADPSRAGMLSALWDGRSRPAGELAQLAGISAATASSHLRRLVAAGLLRVEPRGRHRYFRLAGPEIATTLEALAHLIPDRTSSSARLSPERQRLQQARLCYDHLAGRLGVAITQALLQRRALRLDDGALVPGVRARSGFSTLGVDLREFDTERRALVRTCIDWTERREHLGGALGAGVATALLERDWIRRRRGSRALIVTERGRRELRRRLEVGNWALES